jgi:hypothetical protein
LAGLEFARAFRENAALNIQEVIMAVPKEVREYLKMRGRARRSEWGIADLREPANPQASKPLFGQAEADKIKDFETRLDALVQAFKSPSGNPGYYVVEWRLKPYTKLTRAQMEFVAQAISSDDRKRRLHDCKVDTDANGCGCGCGCGG